MLRESPTHAGALCLSGEIEFARGHLSVALGRFAKAIDVDPVCLPAHMHAGNTLRRLGRPEEGIEAYRRALALNPGNPRVLHVLGLALWEVGRYAEARAVYDRALAVEPDSGELRFARTMAELQIVYESEAELHACRAAYAVRLNDLCARGPAMRSGVGTSQPFYLPYQGADDRALQAQYGAFVCGLMRGRFPPAPLARPPAPGEPVRVGFVSGFFRDGHAIWRIPLKGWMTQLDRRRFRIFGYHTGAGEDSAAATARGVCHRFVSGDRSIADWRAEIVADRPHVLIYPEIGMDPVSAVLAAMRLAPVQCNALGHPETSGYPTLDYFLSSDGMEPADAQERYTERLVRLPRVGAFLEPIAPPRSAITRASIGLPEDVPAFWCGQSFFKFLPRHDGVFARIAQAVGDCRFVFVEHARSVHASATFKRRMAAAFAVEGLDADRHCVFLPQLPQADFIAATGLCDVYLDSLGWSGFNSALEAIAFDKPIVTLPLDALRARHSLALLKALGTPETAADSIDEYVRLAARAALDVSWRGALAAKIARGKSRLYEDRETIEALQLFIEGAARGPGDVARDAAGMTAARGN